MRRSLLSSHKVMPKSMWPHVMQHTRLLCPPLSSRVCSNLCPLSRWCYLSHPSAPPSLLAFNLSQHQGLFQWVSSSHQVAKMFELQLQFSPSNEYSGLISLRMDWLNLLAVQGTLKSLLQHHGSKASIIQCSAFFMVQLLNLCMVKPLLCWQNFV